MPSKGTAVLEVIARWQGEIIQFKTLTPGEALVVGPTPSCDLIVPQQVLVAPTRLVQLDETGLQYTISLPTAAAQLVATEEAGGAQRGVGQRVVGHQYAAELVLGDLSLQLQGAFASDPLPVWAPINWREQRGTLISAAVHLVVLTLVAAVPPDSFALTADTFDTSFRFTPSINQPLEEKDAPWLRKPADGGSKGGKRAAKERGKMGDPKVNKRKRGAYNMKGTDARNQPLGELVKNIGVLGAINSSRSAAVALILDPNERAMSAGTEQVLGGLIGDQIGPEYGSHGLALDGSGDGGGCLDGNCGLVGEGGDMLGDRIGPRNGGPGWRGGWGNGKGPRGGGHKARAPKIWVGSPKLRGALSREIIRRIVRRHRNEVRFCYQQQLQSHRDLRGRLVVNFVIAANGTVALARVHESTLGNGAVESCVAAAVRRWAFPKPEGGGIVTVAYPFTFHAAGSGS